MTFLEKKNFIKNYLNNKTNKNVELFLKFVDSGELSIFILTFMLCISMFTTDLFGPDILYPIFSIIIWRNITQLEPLRNQVDKLSTINEEFMEQINNHIEENDKLNKNIIELKNVKDAINIIAKENNEDLNICISKISSHAEFLKKNVNELKIQNLEYKQQNERHKNFLDRHKPTPESNTESNSETEPELKD